MGIIDTILGAFLKQLFGGIVDWLNAIRRDNALKQLGVETTERQYTEAALKAERAARAILEESRALTGDQLVERLRNLGAPKPGPVGDG